MYLSTDAMVDASYLEHHSEHGVGRVFESTEFIDRKDINNQYANCLQTCG